MRVVLVLYAVLTLSQAAVRHRLLPGPGGAGAVTGHGRLSFTKTVAPPEKICATQINSDVTEAVSSAIVATLDQKALDALKPANVRVEYNCSEAHLQLVCRKECVMKCLSDATFAGTCCARQNSKGPARVSCAELNLYESARTYAEASDTCQAHGFRMCTPKEAVSCFSTDSRTAASAALAAAQSADAHAQSQGMWTSDTCALALGSISSPADSCLHIGQAAQAEGCVAPSGRYHLRLDGAVVEVSLASRSLD